MLDETFIIRSEYQVWQAAQEVGKGLKDGRRLARRREGG
jgi:hypothetical protein